MKLLEGVENSIAQQILQRWGTNPRMLQKAVMAAQAAANGKPQDVFPPGLTLGPEAFMNLSNILRGAIKR